MAGDQFLKLGDIDGESEDKAYAKWIEIEGVSFGVSQTGSAADGGGGGTGKADFHDVNVEKYADSSSTNLFLKCATGKHYPKAEIVIRKAGDNPLDYYKYELTDCMISSFQVHGGGGERVRESVGMNAAKVKLTYTPQDNTGAGGAEMTQTFNVKENSAE